MREGGRQGGEARAGEQGAEGKAAGGEDIGSLEAEEGSELKTGTRGGYKGRRRRGRVVGRQKGVTGGL